MRLAEFILANVEPILAEWEAFARRIWPDTPGLAAIDPSRLRDDAAEILQATAEDMVSPQTASSSPTSPRVTNKLGRQALR